VSALRVSVPGVPTRLVILDDGARPVGRRYIGGSLVAAAPPVPRQANAVSPARAEQLAAAHERYRARHTVTCGLWMGKARAKCARTPDHRGPCRTPTYMRESALGRRSA